MVWCKCVCGLEREHKLTWVMQVFPHQLDLTRALWGQLELCPSSHFQSSCSRKLACGGSCSDRTTHTLILYL